MASLAVALVCDHAFGEVGLHRVQADIRPENVPSQRLVERLGFRQEGLLRRYLDIDGDWRDHLAYALLAEDLPGGVLARWREQHATTLSRRRAGARARATRPSRHTGHTTHQRHTARLPAFDPSTCITSPSRVTHVTGGVRMGSGVLLAALVVLWFVVLVPMVVTRGDAQGGRVELADSGRTLQRRRTVDPVVHADTERVAIDRDLLRTSGELQVDVHALRRRTLGGLVGARRAGPGRRCDLQPLAVDGAGAPRRRRRRLRAGAAQGRPPRAAGGPPGSPCRRPGGAARRRASGPVRGGRARDRRAGGPAGLPHPSVPLAPVHAVPDGPRVVVARTPAPVGWQQSAVVGLDDDDIGFADIDEYQPRRVANA